MKIQNRYPQVQVTFMHYIDIIQGILLGLISILGSWCILVAQEDPHPLGLIILLIFFILGVISFFAAIFIIPLKTVYVLDRSTRELLKLSRGMVLSGKERFNFGEIRAIVLERSAVRLVKSEGERDAILFLSSSRSAQDRHCRKLAEILAKNLEKDIIDRTGPQPVEIHHAEIEGKIKNQLTDHSRLHELMTSFRGKITAGNRMVEISEFQVLVSGKKVLALISTAAIMLMLIIPSFPLIADRHIPQTVIGIVFICGLGIAVALAIIAIIGSFVLYSPVIITFRPGTIQVGHHVFRRLKTRGEKKKTSQLRDVRLYETKKGKYSVEMVFDTSSHIINWLSTRTDGEQLKEVILESIKAVKG